MYTKNEEFEWDESKNVSNYRKHGVWFEESVSVFSDPNAREIHDVDHSSNEERWVILGISEQLRILIVIYVERNSGESIRIISARKANRVEVAAYGRFIK